MIEEEQLRKNIADLCDILARWRRTTAHLEAEMEELLLILEAARDGVPVDSNLKTEKILPETEQ